MKRITQKEVALEANASLKTISRVVNNSSLVNKETKEKILKIIEELNYRPNLVARSLKNKSSNCIGIVIDDISSPAYIHTIKELESIANYNNYSIFFCDSQYKPELAKKHLENLTNRMVEGIIIIPSFEIEQDYIKSIAETGIKIVFFGNKFNYSHNNVDVVYINESKSVKMAVQHLIENGHKKIIFINTEIDIISKYLRLEGYKYALRNNKLLFDKSLVFETDNSMEGGYNISKKIFNSDINFSAIMCFNDIIALGVLKYCYDNNIKIPDEYSLFGFDDVVCGQVTTPPLSTIGLSKIKVGRILGDLLFQKIKGNNLKNTYLELNTHLVIRKSVKNI